MYCSVLLCFMQKVLMRCASIINHPFPCGGSCQSHEREEELPANTKQLLCAPTQPGSQDLHIAYCRQFPLCPAFCLFRLCYACLVCVCVCVCVFWLPFLTHLSSFCYSVISFSYLISCTCNYFVSFFLSYFFPSDFFVSCFIFLSSSFLSFSVFSAYLFPFFHFSFIFLLFRSFECMQSLFQSWQFLQCLWLF
jgi:hypothetical protein